ncbi:MAG: histidine phosphatase family protein [Deltaproteobacteria bacterium]|nr:histidine phosphatase family protein [Deltaproteobacteria bacterium]
MTLELLLVRHAESEGNRAKAFTGHGPSRLSPRGLLQAEALARHLEGTALDAVYCSDLPRARQTLEPALRRRSRSPVYTPALRERAMGVFTGLSFAEVEALHPDGWEHLKRRTPGYSPPEGESHDACFARVGTFAQALVERHPSGRVLLVSHGVALHHLLRWLLGTPPEVLFAVDNASLHRLERRPGGATRVLGLNLTEHLAGL